MINETKRLCVYVDDSPLCGRVGKTVLGLVLGKGWEVIHIEDPRVGLEVALQHYYLAKKVHMMVLDQNMPSFTGTTIALNCRERELETGKEPIRLYLHSSDNCDLQEYFYLFDGVIPKPINQRNASAAIQIK